MTDIDQTRIDRRRTMDQLTGLLNREGWEGHAPAFLEAADETRVPVCLLLLDLDDFGLINARQGVGEGDRVLKGVASLWRSHIRQSDAIARVGPDEFAVLLVGCSLEAASAVARRLCSLLDVEILSASVGGAEWNGSETPAELLARAEGALHHAKNASGDRISIASDVPMSTTTT